MTDGGNPGPKTGLRMTLVAMGLGIFVIANDFSAVNVALPTIEKDFGSDLSTVQWVINGYALTFGVLIVTGGRLADVFGRRNALVVGAGIFAVMSLVAGLAPNIEVLIGARVLMGVGAALMWPAILGLTFAAIGTERAAFAGALILGIAGAGNAIGPLLGGMLTEFASWRWVLLLNIPIALFTIVVTYLRVHPEEAAEGERRLDYAGVATLSLGLVALLFALDQSSAWGWSDPRVLGPVIASPLLLIAFVFIEKNAGPKALIPRDVMNPKFVAACGAIFLASIGFFAPVLYLPQYFQKVLGHDPFQSGLDLLPMLLTFAVVSFIAGKVYDRVGAKATVAAGAGFMTLGIGMIAFAGDGAKLPALVPGMLVLGVGIGLFYSATTTAGVTSLDESRASLAGAILYMFQIAGGSVLLGATTAIFTAKAKESSFTDGFQLALGIDTLLSLSALVVAVLFVGGRLSARRPSGDGGAPPTKE